ncbi:hypothetical protein C2G38_2151057 [Gigaspora rosea]|uniref:Aspartic peptidase domain-containing protein n=1 Tax=Gigaspora rosea TaxID=44941 RepID=A0A397WB72_9GLOM|nr:hypothetical protein C2G38_2151057 [Gigaspora rosea]
MHLQNIERAFSTNNILRNRKNVHLEGYCIYGGCIYGGLTVLQLKSAMASTGTLATHLYEEAKNANLVQTPAYTTLFKYNVSLQNKPYQAIIDSSASISMIAYKAVKKLGLTIKKASNSLIVPAVGTSTHSLGIIKDLSVKIDHITISLTVEVVDTTSYSLLLGNDWNQKVKANYN